MHKRTLSLTDFRLSPIIKGQFGQIIDEDDLELRNDFSFSRICKKPDGRPPACMMELNAMRLMVFGQERKDRQEMASPVYHDLEKELVLLAQQGDRKSLEDLIKRSQPWIFNLVLRMVPDFHEAEDLSQEILLKTILKLPTFRAESRFNTWLYRIAVNHVLGMRQSNCEKAFSAQENWSDDELMNRYLDQEIADPKAIPCDLELIIKETRIKCMLGMLLCLNRKYRMVFVLGSILGINGKSGAEILGMSEANYRKILSRARGRLVNYMKDCCSLMNPGKPCTCERSVPVSIQNGSIDPLKLVFNAKDVPTVREILSRNRERLDNIESRHCQDLYRENPFQVSPDFSRKVLDLLRCADFQGFLDTGSTN